MKCTRKTRVSKGLQAVASRVMLTMILFLLGCGASPQRKEAIQELEKLQAEVHGLHILVSAGVTDLMEFLYHGV